MFRAIKGMFEVVKARAHMGGDLAECFNFPQWL